jgi:hypothetical protein
MIGQFDDSGLDEGGHVGDVEEHDADSRKRTLFDP